MTNMQHPQHPPCPVSFLCNYNTYVLYHLRHIKQLDSVKVSGPPCLPPSSCVSQLNLTVVTIVGVHMISIRRADYGGEQAPG